MQRFQEYDFKVYHRKEILHKNADAKRKPTNESFRYVFRVEKSYQLIKPSSAIIKSKTKFMER